MRTSRAGTFTWVTGSDARRPFSSRARSPRTMNSGPKLPVLKVPSKGTFSVCPNSSERAVDSRKVYVVSGLKLPSRPWVDEALSSPGPSGHWSLTAGSMVSAAFSAEAFTGLENSKLRGPVGQPLPHR